MRESRLDRDIEETLGERIRADVQLAERCWGSLANIDWVHEDGEVAGHSFRSAGRLLAEIRGTGDEPYCYMEFYCSVPDGVIDPECAEALASRGWEGRKLR